jgi:hypothetical protein
MTHDQYLAQYDAGDHPITVCCCLSLRINGACRNGCPDSEWRPWFIEHVSLDGDPARVAQLVVDRVRERLS